MKAKLFFMSLFLLGCSAVQARTGDPGANDRRKEECTGIVLQSDTKKPLKAVTVTAYSASKKEKVELTDDSGNFSFDELKPGIYKFVFEKDGYRKITREKVVIKTDEAFQLNIEMIENSEFEIMPAPSYFSGV